MGMVDSVTETTVVNFGAGMWSVGGEKGDRLVIPGCGTASICTRDGSQEDDEGIARRIVASVNALAGLSVEQIERGQPWAPPTPEAEGIHWEVADLGLGYGVTLGRDDDGSPAVAVRFGGKVVAKVVIRQA